MSLLSGIDLDGIAAEVTAHAPEAHAFVPIYEEPICLPFEDARGSVLAAS